MKHGKRTVCIFLMSLIGSLFISLPVLAVPQLPSSFYGTVEVNGTNVPDGTSVQALIDGKVYAEELTQTYQGDSVYALNVTGDDTDTTVQDGGREGDTVQFKIGGVLASQTGIWHSGTNVSLDLKASTSSPLATPMVTLTQAPTQAVLPTLRPTTVPATSTTPRSPTSTPVVQSSPVPTKVGQSSQTPTSPSQSIMTATGSIQFTPVFTKSKQPKPTSASSESKPGTGLSGLATVAVIVMVTLVVAMIIGYIIMTNRGI